MFRNQLVLKSAYILSDRGVTTEEKEKWKSEGALIWEKKDAGEMVEGELEPREKNVFGLQKVFSDCNKIQFNLQINLLLVHQ